MGFGFRFYFRWEEFSVWMLDCSLGDKARSRVRGQSYLGLFGVSVTER